MNEDEIFDFDEEEQKPSPRRLIYRIIGILLIFGLIYVYGIQQALFYRRTPAGTPQERLESVLNAETLTVPLEIFVFRNEGQFGSERTVVEVQEIVGNASNIWAQADIELTAGDVFFLEVSDEELELFFEKPRLFAMGLEEYSEDAISVFFIESLSRWEGINGVAFIGSNMIAVADTSTAYDFRVLAHEIGHILGLPHAEGDKSRLMYQGANGVDLTEEEILRARARALGY